jgi:hypothetical protein
MLHLIAALACLAPQELIDNPQFAHWKSFKPGTWVKHSMLMDARGMQVKSETTTTLLEVTAEKVVLETRVAMDMGGRKMDMPPAKKDVPAKVEKKPGQAPPSEKEEDVVVDGKTYKCRQWEWEQAERGGSAAKAKGWICADVPGGMVKSEVSSPQMPTPVQVTLAGFEKK